MSSTDGIALDMWRASAREFSFVGKRIRYWTAGEGEPLLLIHGFPDRQLGTGTRSGSRWRRVTG